MNYQQTIEYLYGCLPMFSNIGASALKNDLHNIIALCDVLDHPEAKFPTIHIAGTNGKGSTSHMLSAILQEAGYKTGLYTSPHLHDFRERIRVNGEMIPGEVVASFVTKIQPHIEQIDPSFFEVTVAMAFEYFAEQQVDVAIIETGLGGRLDSTNIITPILSLITNISFDHMNILGNTLPLIASEKAGIIKPGVPVVISETQPEIAQIFIDTAARCQAPITFADQQLRITAHTPNADELQLTLSDTRSFTLDLPGRYQGKNLLGVLEAVRILQQRGWQISEAQLQSALRQVKKLTGMRGRWEVIGHHPYTVLDVGHNAAGIREILAQLELVQYNKLHIVTGFVKDKDVAAALLQLPEDAVYYFTQAKIPRALDVQELVALGNRIGRPGKAYNSVPEAYKAARADAAPEDMVLVCGSFFIVGDMEI